MLATISEGKRSGSRDHDYEDCPKRKADAERQKEEQEGQGPVREGLLAT